MTRSRSRALRVPRSEATDDAHLFRLHVATGDGRGDGVELVVDTLDERFWSFHTWAPARDAHALLKAAVERRRDLDWAWLPTGHLRRVWAEARPVWLRSDFLGERTLPEDDPARRVQLRLRGAHPEGLLALLHDTPYAKAAAIDQVGVVVDEPAFGRIQEGVNRHGRFVSSGDSFALHQEVVRLAVARYRRLVEAVERCALRWGGGPESGLTLSGAAIALSFAQPVADLDRLVDALLSCREPFRLWGVPRERDGLVTVEAVDLHVGQRLRLELTDAWLRVLLEEGACGNTVARLVSNLQHTVDAQVAFDDPELQAALEAT